MLLPLAILGIFLSVILLYFNARKYTSTVYLGLFFLFISLYSIIQYVVLFSKSVVLIGIVFTNVGFPTYLIGPMLYLYFRSVLSDNARLKKHDLWHLLPMLIFLAGTFPYLTSPWSFKLEVAQKIIGKDIMLTPYNSDLVSMYKYISLPVVFLSRPVLVMGYLLWSAGLLIRFKMYHKESRVLQQQRFMQKWLWILLVFLFILVLSHALQLVETFTVMSTAIFKTLNLLQVFAGIGLVGLLISPFFFPEILYGLPRLPKSLETSEIAVMANEPLPAETVSVSSKFESDYLDLIGKQTDQCMNEYQPYLLQDFNLAQLSVLISVPVHHLAYYFREVKLMSFTDFRNHWRIEHSKNLIHEGKSNDLTLEAIGFLSGFSSRNTFLNAFKKAEGISPQSFLTNIKKKEIF